MRPSRRVAAMRREWWCCWLRLKAPRASPRDRRRWYLLSTAGLLSLSLLLLLLLLLSAGYHQGY